MKKVSQVKPPNRPVSFNITLAQEEKLRLLSTEKDRSMSFLIREAIDKMEAPSKPKKVKI